jgi:hypothetical protein
MAIDRTTSARRLSRSATAGPGDASGKAAADKAAAGKAATSPPAAATVWSLIGPVDEPSVRTAELRTPTAPVVVTLELPEPPEPGEPGGRLDIPPVPGCEATVPVAMTLVNGLLDVAHLCQIGDGHQLRPDAAAAFLALDAAYHNATGARLCVTDSYRSLAAQVSLRARKPRLAALPGTSEHGWGLALDIGCGVNTYHGDAHKWLVEHAGAYGWVNPGWAQADGSKPEPWHWEFKPELLG